MWARPLLATALLALSAAQRPPVAHLARALDGDTFDISGPGCGGGKCAEFNGEAAGARGADACACACPPRAPLFREDVSLCVDHVAECTLAPFGTGSTAQKVPFVFLPLKGQIIHPSKEISFPGVQTPTCAVSGSQFLTRRGFVDLRNSLDADVPFSLFRDEGRTFLQWTGESELRTRMAGRLLLVRLLCSDTALAGADLSRLFTPCVSFRVQGAPALHINNVNEVLFAPNAQSSENTTAPGLTVTEYVAIGVASLLLGLIYVASVFLYLHIRKRRRNNDEIESKSKKSRGNDNSSGDFDHDIVVINSGNRQSLDADDGAGVVKNNPLLSMGMGMHYHDMKGGFVNECAQSGFMEHEQQLNIEMDAIEDDGNSSKTQIISAVIHPGVMNTRSDFTLGDSSSYHEQIHSRDESGIERLPEENVSIVETMDGRDEKPEVVRTFGSTRRKLYFNPAYFEPDLLLDPPPAALEFLTKIREVITIAKHKMTAKRFQPMLNQIPEEETYQSYDTSMDFHASFGSQRSSMVTLKRENSRKKPPACIGCPGCKSKSQGDLTNRFLCYSRYGACTNCSSNKGDKQSSIRKWLEDIPVMKQSLQYGEITHQSPNSGLLNSLLSLPMDINKTNRNSRRRPNRFDNTKSLYEEDLSSNYRIKHKASTLSVRSEPPIRNYNFPLPDFGNYQCTHQHGLQTIARTEDITPIGINFRSPIAAHAAYNRNNTNLHSNFMPDMINDLAHEHRKILAKYDAYGMKGTQGHKEDKPTLKPNGSDTPFDTYETDSLEKSMNVKGFSASTEYAEILSAQPSPSLSTALPLEEELTMRNAVYKINSSSGHSSTPSPNTDMNEQNIYETIGECTVELDAVNVQPTQQDDYSLVSEVYVNNSYNFGSAPTSPSGSESSVGSRKVPNIRYTEKDEHPGRLTIIVQDPPENYIRIHESDGFEPDTLDRKHPNTVEKFCSPLSNKETTVKSIENSLVKDKKSQIQLKTNGTFKTNTKHDTEDADNGERPFNSLRDIYEHKNASSFTRPRVYNQGMTGTKSLGHLTNEMDWNSEEGRILTLELRHSKRQRQCTPPTVKQIEGQVRPDVIPPLSPMDENPIYEQPKPPRRVPPNQLNQKNVNDRSFDPRIRDAHKSHSPTCVSLNRTPCSPPGASVKSSISASDYENVHSINSLQARPGVQNSISLQKKLIDDELSRASVNKNDQYNIHMERENFLKGNVSPNRHHDNKMESHRRSSIRALNPRKAQNHKEDSGYLSSDSNYSVRPGKRAIIHTLSCSETDDTENEARSESGAESVETNSVFFGSFRKFSAQDAEKGVTSFNKRITKVEIFEPSKNIVAMQ